jgi:hypothetical protein
MPLRRILAKGCLLLADRLYGCAAFASLALSQRFSAWFGGRIRLALLRAVFAVVLLLPLLVEATAMLDL